MGPLTLQYPDSRGRVFHVHRSFCFATLGRRTHWLLLSRSAGAAECVDRLPVSIASFRARQGKARQGKGRSQAQMMAALKPTATRHITHVLFDMDGLLLDTEKFYTVVQEKILAEYGKTFDWSLKAKMMGKKALEAGQIFVQDTGLTGLLTPEEFITRRELMLHAMFPESDLMPGAEQLIQHLHANNVPMAIATSSHRRHFELKSTKHGPLFSLMHHVVTGDDPGVVNGKPAPDIFLIAANRFEEPGLKLANVLVLEDAPSGVAAAHAAGMSVVMVPDPNMESSLCQEADQVLTSLNDFDYAHWGLPCK